MDADNNTALVFFHTTIFGQALSYVLIHDTTMLEEGKWTITILQMREQIKVLQ